MSPQAEQRLLILLQGGTHLNDIMKIEGLDPGNAPKEVKRIAEKHGLNVVCGPRHHGTQPPVPFVPLKAMLRVRRLLEVLVENENREDLCWMIGLTRREQSRALLGVHDWTMSQLVRFSELFGTTPDKILHLMYGLPEGEPVRAMLVQLEAQYKQRNNKS